MNRIKNSFIAFLSLVLFLCLSLSLQAQIIYKPNGFGGNLNSPANYPPGSGAGHMVAGDLWDAFLTANNDGGPFWSGTETNDRNTLGGRVSMRNGTLDRNWQTATGNWPIAYPLTIWWSKYFNMYVYDPDPTFCPAQINGVANPSYYANSRDSIATGGPYFSKYAQLIYHPNVQGANDPSRNYMREAYFVDGTQRNHVVYEAGWPTNVGIDVKLRVHQFAAPNWNNFNDFIIMEVSLKNTGVVDLNFDGTAEKTNHKIEALGASYAATVGNTFSQDISGGRVMTYQMPNPARMSGYIGDDDPEGNPWNLFATWFGTSEDPPTRMDMGLQAYQVGYYMDQYHGWSWLNVKKGGLPADPAKGTYSNEDKNNIWGVDLIGKGSQRGWFTSAGIDYVGGAYGNPKTNFYLASATWYENGLKDFNANLVSLRPNPKFFDIAQNNEFESITNWVPKRTTGITEAERPNGDAKLLSLENSNALTNINDPDGAGYPKGKRKMSKGFSRFTNFDGDVYSGIGPLSLDVNEEVTIVFVIAAGYRLEGFQKAVRAARFAYENDYNIPTPPPMPDIKVRNTLEKTVYVEWDNVAESDPNFAGYKIWKSSNHLRYSYLEDGMRIVDRYQEQMNVVKGSEDAKKQERAQFAKPVNPRFNAHSYVASVAGGGQYAGYTWGTWDLIAVIPKTGLDGYKNAITDPYTYLYHDLDVVVGFNYWYYVSAYKEGTFTGPGGETTNRLETHSTNRNGANGFWQGTWPFATANADFKTNDPKFLKEVGSAHRVTSAMALTSDLNAGTVKVGVRPNPYKRAALHDNFNNVYDHQIMFYNLPQNAKITITDVAGKIIQVANFVTSDPTKGSYFWDMFSKDGNEVASGLYLYYIEWDGGFTKGKFAILR
jgi:hypothetical protein